MAWKKYHFCAYTDFNTYHFHLTLCDNSYGNTVSKAEIRDPGTATGQSTGSPHIFLINA